MIGLSSTILPDPYFTVCQLPYSNKFLLVRKEHHMNHLPDDVLTTIADWL
jgi:hypothetical protein